MTSAHRRQHGRLARPPADGPDRRDHRERRKHIESERVLDEQPDAGRSNAATNSGQLARVFKTTAHDFLTREKTLDALVVQRTAALEEKNGELEGSRQLCRNISTPQLYEKLFRGRQVAPMTAQRKKLTILFADIVSFSEIAESLEVEDLTRRPQPVPQRNRRRRT